MKKYNHIKNPNKLKWLTITILSILLIIGIIIFIINNQRDYGIKTINSSNSLRGDIVSKKTESIVPNGIYQNYTPSLLANAKENGKVILFFNASWDTKSQNVAKDINSKITKIPKEVTILSLDYDNYTEIKQKYGITNQPSFVRVSEKGELLKKGSGFNTLEDILKFFN